MGADCWFSEAAPGKKVVGLHRAQVEVTTLQRASILRTMSWPCD